MYLRSKSQSVRAHNLSTQCCASRNIKSDTLYCLIWKMFYRGRLSLTLSWQPSGKRLTIASLLSVPTAASQESSVNTALASHTPPHTWGRKLPIHLHSPATKNLLIEMHTHLKSPALNTRSLHPSFSPSFSCFTRDIRMSLSKSSMPFSFFSSFCLPAVEDWELTADKWAACFWFPKKKRKGDRSIQHGVVCFSAFLCTLLQILASSNVVVITESGLI